MTGHSHGHPQLLATTLGEEPFEERRIRTRLFDGRHVVETWVFGVLDLGSTGVEDGLVDGSVRLFDSRQERSRPVGAKLERDYTTCGRSTVACGGIPEVSLRICGILNIIEALLPARSRRDRSATTAPSPQPERREAEEEEAVTAKNIVRARARSMST